MPAQARKHASTETTPSVAPAQAAPAANGQKYGNEAEQARVGGDAASGDAGLASYESALGDFLGGELYKAVSGALAFEKFSSAAHSLVDGALKAAVQQAGGWEKVKADPAALDALVKILDDLAGPAVDKWLEQDGKDLQEKLAKWAGAHPRTVATVALLAAVGAVIANVDLPTLKSSFGLGKDTKGEIEADLGKVRALSLKKVRAKITHEAGPLLAAVEVTHEGGKTEGSAELKVGQKDGDHILANGKMDGDGLKVAGLEGVVQTDVGKLSGSAKTERGQAGVISKLTLERQSGQTTITDGFTYDGGAGVLTIGRDTLTDLGGGVTAKSGFKTGSDGSGEYTAGLSSKQEGVEKNLSFSAKQGAYGLTEEQKLELGMKYDKQGLKAQLDAEIASLNGANRAKVSGSAEKDLGEGYRAGGSFNAVVGDDKLLEVGAFYGFKDPNAFRSWLVEYKYNSRLDDNQFKAVVENTLGDVKMRYQGAMQWGGAGRNLDVSVHGAYFFDKDTAAIAGVNYKRDFENGAKNLTPEIGIQHKGVQVLFGYDTESKAATVRLGIPF